MTPDGCSRAPARSAARLRGAARRAAGMARRGARRRPRRLWAVWPSLPILTKADLRGRFSARACRRRASKGRLRDWRIDRRADDVHPRRRVRAPDERDHARGAAGARLEAGDADDLRVGRPARHRPGPHRLSTRAPRPHQPAVAAARGRRLRADRGHRAPRPRPAPREPRRRRHLRLQLDARSRRARGAGARLASPGRSGQVAWNAARCCTTSR